MLENKSNKPTIYNKKIIVQKRKTFFPLGNNFTIYFQQLRFVLFYGILEFHSNENNNTVCIG